MNKFHNIIQSHLGISFGSQLFFSWIESASIKVTITYFNIKFTYACGNVFKAHYTFQHFLKFSCLSESRPEHPFIQPFIQLPTLQYSIYPYMNQITPDNQALSQQLAQRIYL